MEQKYTDLLAIKYVPHGRSVKDGLDCVGLCLEVLKRNGIYMPDFWNCPTVVPADFFEKIEELEENCIISMTMFGRSHMAVYIGDGMMIHARTDCGIIIEPIERYQTSIRGYYKVVINKHI